VVDFTTGWNPTKSTVVTKQMKREDQWLYNKLGFFKHPLIGLNTNMPLFSPGLQFFYTPGVSDQARRHG